MNKKIFSAPLFVENLKRYWSMSALGFVVLFMSLPFYLLRSIDDGYSYYRVNDALINHNVGFMMVNLILPIVAAVTLFAYLYKVNSVSTMHALPFSKTSLYVTNYVSGMVLVCVPYILTAVLMIALKQPTYAIEDSADIYTVSAVFGWLLNCFSIVLFIFSIAVVGCMISGNGVIATLTACALNFLLPGLYLVCCGYMQQFSFGYTGNYIQDVIFKFSPYLMVFDNFTVVAQLLYIGIALVIAVLGWYAYYCRKLERCGDSYVFKWVENVIGFIFVFVISSGCGLILFEGMGVWSYVIGGIFGFILGQMITRKTFRLWNKRTLKNLVVFAVIMAVVISAFAIDIFGYEKKVPNAEKVKYAYVDGYVLHIDSSYSYDGIYAQEKDEIAFVTDFHNEIIENQDKIEDESLDSFYNGSYIEIRYGLNNGSVMSREYWVSYDFLENSTAFNQLINSGAATQVIRNMENFDSSKCSFRFSSEFDLSIDRIPELTSVQKKELLEAIEKDYLERLTNFTSDGINILTINMEYTDRFEGLSSAEEFFSSIVGYSYYDKYSNSGAYVGTYRYNAGNNSKNVLAWIEKYGLADELSTKLPDNAYLLISYNDSGFYNLENYNGSSNATADLNELKHKAAEYDIIVIDNEDTANYIIENAAVASYYDCEGDGDNAFWAGIYLNEPGHQYISYTMMVDYTKLPKDVQEQVK